MRKTVVASIMCCKGFNNDAGATVSTSIEIRKPLARAADDVI